MLPFAFGDNTGTPESNTYLTCAGVIGSKFFAGGWTTAMDITEEATAVQKPIVLIFLSDWTLD